MMNTIFYVIMKRILKLKLMMKNSCKNFVGWQGKLSPIINEENIKDEIKINENDDEACRKVEYLRQNRFMLNRKNKIENDDEDCCKKSVLEKKKGKDAGSGKHNKFNEDNLRRKTRHLVLDIDINFLNEQIKKKCNG